jgi:hypothetical protein
VDEAAEYCPATQARQEADDADPISRELVPAAHASHVVAVEAITLY